MLELGYDPWQNAYILYNQGEVIKKGTYEECREAGLNIFQEWAENGVHFELPYWAR